MTVSEPGEAVEAEELVDKIELDEGFDEVVFDYQTQIELWELCFIYTTSSLICFQLNWWNFYATAYFIGYLTPWCVLLLFQECVGPDNLPWYGAVKYLAH